MKRIVIHLLLALALILQGAAGTFGATSSATRASCCPHGMSYSDMSVHHSRCPCPQQQTCASDCQLMCAAGTVMLAPQVFVTQSIPAPAALVTPGGTRLRPRSDTPPIRPPIA